MAFPTFNLFAGETETPPWVPPAGYDCRLARLGPRLGAQRIGLSVYDLGPGQALCPYHFEWSDEEWLIVLAGSATLRGPEGVQLLEPGEAACFPAGPAGAHQVRNDGEEGVRVALLSTKSALGVVEYPDSDKVAVWAGGEERLLVRRSPQLDYWDGERERSPQTQS